ncbi:MAG TPA: P-loop NTPase [Pirellulales bacterium]|nr:P-loop NTPase [Pirellulales bacterium]
MTDQANELRQLVLRSARSGPAVPYNAPCIIVLTSGKGGVGTTTIAVNLAAALARDGRRTVLVDADFKNADATKLCRVDATDTVADVLSGRRSVHEALERGPAGVLVLPGAWGRAELVDCSETAQQRLLTQLVHLGAHADFVIVDIGSGASRVAARFWNAADRILLVTTPEAMAIMDTYALLKTLAASDRRNVGTLINNASSPRTATDAHQRLSRASKRFLGFELDSFGSIDEHPAIAAATAECQLLSTSSDPSAAAAFERLATTLTQSLPGRQTEPCVA